MLSRFDIGFKVICITSILIRCYFAHVTIEQCPGIEVQQVRHQVENHEVSLIFYYTRWSADSLNALKVYNDVAQYYSDFVYFSSIDCWHLSCNCSRTLNTAIGSGLPHKWPTLVAYYGRRGQLQIMYHGLWSFGDIQQFINNILYPLERVRSRNHLWKMKAVSDAVIVGVFESPNSIEYQQYLIASLKWLESDPQRTYRFTVTFNDDAKQVSNSSNEVQVANVIFMGPSVTRNLKNVRNQTWNASSILMWLHKELKRDMNHLHGYETPITIAQKVIRQPVLTIFINNPQKFFSYIESYVDSDLSFSSKYQKCAKMQYKKSEHNNIKSLRIKTLAKELTIYSDHSKCYYNISVLWRNLAYFFEIDLYIRQSVFNLVNEFIKKEKEISQIESFLNIYQTLQCLNNDLASSSSLQVGSAKYLQSLTENEVQLFNSNRSISVVLLETERYKDYLDNLKIEVQTESMTTCFIVDKDHESIFIMDKFFSIENIREFIHRFFSLDLNTHFKSESVNALKPPINSMYNSYELINLNREQFVDYLRFSYNQTLVVLIYSDECALCSNLQQTFVQLAASFRHVSSEVKFVRINAFHNNLPWQFKMPSLPALLVFPKYKHDETRLFPTHLKPDIRNVFAFLLNQFPPQNQIKIVIGYCQSSVLSSKTSQSCWQFAKTLLMQHIGKHLHYWQLYETERNEIFEHLRAFKDMSLDIQRNLKL